MVAGSSPPVAGSGEDDWCWGGESNGHFSIKSAYELLRSNVQAADTLWDKIWRWKGPARVNHFLWLAAQNKLLTNSQRVKRKIASDGSCGYCQDESEDVIHILRDCRFAKEVWELSGIQASNPQAWQVQRQEWLRIGITSAESTRFGLTCWALWKARNERIFSNGQINSDGSVLQPSGLAAVGGLIRNEVGHCTAAYSLNLGKCSITRAELRGALFGLHKAWDLGYRKVLMLMDSTAAIKIFEKKEDTQHQHAAEACQFQELQARNWEIRLQHTYREANKAADHLANRGHSLPLGDHSVPTSDPELGFILRYDCYGISELRTITIND
ncbi:Putative ribonuclease H protein At1g65750 [Linum perenne]